MVTMHVPKRKVDIFVLCSVHLYMYIYIYIYHNFLVVLWSCTAIPSLAIYFLAVHRMVRMILCWMMMFYTASEKFWLIKSNMIFQKIYFSLHLPYPTQFFNQALQLAQWNRADNAHPFFLYWICILIFFHTLKSFYFGGDIESSISHSLKLSDERECPINLHIKHPWNR